MTIRLTHLNQISEVAKQLWQQIRFTPARWIVFRGEMGAGKTTLIKALLRQMETEEQGASPTFSVINEYFSVHYGTVYHMDAYRIESESEMYDIGIEELIASNAYCLVEWPERIENLLPEGSVSLSITLEEQDRIIELQL